MTNHPDERLSAYLDDELNETEKREVERHLASCESCQAQLEELLSLQQAVFQAYTNVQAPADLEERILQALAQKPAPEPVPKAWLSLPLIALVFLSAVWAMGGGIIMKLLSVAVKVSIALLYFVSHLFTAAPVLTGFTVLVSVGVLMLSGYSLRQLLLTNE